MKKIDYYVIDTSSLIELNRRYPIDVFPNLWKNVEGLISKGFLISPEEVRKELLVKDDSLKEWVTRQRHLFKPLTAKQIEIVRDIIQKFPSLAEHEKEIPVADPFVIALAVELEDVAQTTLAPIVKRRIIVTEERLRGEKIKIPFVSRNYGIECIIIIDMCRAEGWKF